MDGRSSSAQASKTRTREVAAAEATSRSPQQDIHSRANGLPFSPMRPPSPTLAPAGTINRLSQRTPALAASEGSDADASGETPCRTSSAYILLQLRDMCRTSSNVNGLVADTTGHSALLASAPVANPVNVSSTPTTTTRTDNEQRNFKTLNISNSEQRHISNNSGNGSNTSKNKSSTSADGRKNIGESNPGFTEGVAAGMLEGAVAAAAVIERGMYVGLLPGFNGASRGGPSPSSVMPQLQQSRQARTGRAGGPSVGAGTAVGASRAQGRAPARQAPNGPQTRPPARPQGGRPSNIASVTTSVGGRTTATTSTVGGAGLRPICPKGGSTEPLVISPATGQLVPVSHVVLGTSYHTHELFW